MTQMLNTNAFKVTYKTNTDDALGVRDEGIEGEDAPIVMIVNLAMALLIISLIVLFAVYYRRFSHSTN